MALRKEKHFDSADIAMAKLAKALSHPARIQILRTLVCNELCNCAEIVCEVPLAQSTVSQHLKALKEAGLIHGEANGPASSYSVNYAALLPAFERLNGFYKFLKKEKGAVKCKPTRKKACC